MSFDQRPLAATAYCCVWRRMKGRPRGRLTGCPSEQVIGHQPPSSQAVVYRPAAQAPGVVKVTPHVVHDHLYVVGHEAPVAAAEPAGVSCGLYTDLAAVVQELLELGSHLPGSFVADGQIVERSGESHDLSLRERVAEWRIPEDSNLYTRLLLSHRKRI